MFSVQTGADWSSGVGRSAVLVVVAGLYTATPGSTVIVGSGASARVIDLRATAWTAVMSVLVAVAAGWLAVSGVPVAAAVFGPTLAIGVVAVGLRSTARGSRGHVTHFLTDLVRHRGAPAGTGAEFLGTLTDRFEGSFGASTTSEKLWEVLYRPRACLIEQRKNRRVFRLIV